MYILHPILSIIVDEKRSVKFRNMFASYRGLCGCTSCCISQWTKELERTHFDLPHLRIELSQFLIQFEILTPEDFPQVKISFRFAIVNDMSEYVVCHSKVSFVLFGQCASVAPVNRF